MNDNDTDLTYFTAEEIREPYIYGNDDDQQIPMAFCHVVGLLEELDELEATLYRLDTEDQALGDDDVDEGEVDDEEPDDDEADDEGWDDDDERLDTRCLIDSRYEDIDQLIEIFARTMPATFDALVALNAMLIALERPQHRSGGLEDNDPSIMPARLVRRWLSETAGCDPDSEFHEFRACVEYLFNLPTGRSEAAVQCPASW